MTETQTQTAVRYDRDADGIVTLTLDDPTASANTMNELYRDSMAAAVDRLYDEVADVTGVVVASAKKTFFAGGNLKLMVQATKDDALQIFESGETIKASLRRLETYPRPVVAAINGAALGGGYEITLACNHRIIVDDDKVEIGLPEASLGLLPGGGGVTRVVRLLGIQSALMDVLLQGTRFKPGVAKEKGLVDELVATREDLVPAAKAWIKANPEVLAEPVGRRRLPDARWYAEQPQAGSVPAGVPGAAPQADQGRGLPGPAGDPVRRGRGRPGRLRHCVPDRVALPDQADRQPELEEHDPGVLLRPPGDQRRQAAAGRGSRRTRQSRSAFSAPG